MADAVFVSAYFIYERKKKMQYYSETVENVMKEVNSCEDGLKEEQAGERLLKNGKNKLSEGKKDSIIKKFFMQMTDPMILVLLAAALVSGILAVYENESFTDVIIILFVVIVNAILGVYQESKAEKAIEALQKMAAATSKVIRNGKIEIIHSEDIVVGDVVVLEAGDAVPADGRIIECASMKIEEAALTGESVPVDKLIELIELKENEKEVPLGDRKNMVYMGSTVVYGRGKFVVTNTGMDTEMGKIAGVLADAKEGETPLQKKLNELSKILTWLVLGICVVIFGVQLLRAGNLGSQVVISSFMIAVSLAVAAIPEGLAAVVTVVLSIGVTNMSKRSAIIRKLTAVETLGCAQIICSDKTGTLTQNKMTVVEYFGDKELLKTAMALCSDAKIDENGDTIGEPTEAALVNWAAKENMDKNEKELKMPRVMEAPFDSKRKMMSTIHKNEDGIIQFTKGAPDEVLKRCTHILKNGEVLKITDEDIENIVKENKNMADKALRVLCGAYKNWDELPKDADLEILENDLIFIGLTGMIDPVRPEVKDAIEECADAGIRPIMITGDHIDTAIAIAKELGILTDGQKAITGSMLNEMDDEQFQKEFMNIRVYARVQPEHKTRIVNAWRNAGYITAMTGDGVNDAPSIKSADIGVGMGITGTDVTKNVADMVLADDNFATIVGAVEEGRRIYDNIRKAIQFLLGSNMSEVISIFVATILGFTILEPVHLLWINLVTDCFPALALGMEKAENGIMRRKPRGANEGVFSNGLGVDVVYQGVLLSLLTIMSYFIGHYIESGVWEIANSKDGITMAFLTLSMAEIVHSFNMRSQRGSLFKIKGQNKFLTLSGLAAFLLTTVVCEVPFLANAFGFSAVSLTEYVIAIALAFAMLPLVEFVKLVQRKLKNNKR